MATGGLSVTHPKRIAERLRDTRAALNYGRHGQQKQYAENADIQPNRYNQWEKGSRPDLDGALQLCETYRLTLDWIFRGDDSCLPHHIVRRIAEIRADQTAPPGGAEVPGLKKARTATASKKTGT